MNYSLRTVGADGLSENVLIGHNMKYMGRKHPDFQKFKEESGYGEETDVLMGVFLHPYGLTGYTLAYSHSDYYIVMPNGETYDSYCFSKSNNKSLEQSEHKDGILPFHKDMDFFFWLVKVSKLDKVEKLFFYDDAWLTIEEMYVIYKKL